MKQNRNISGKQQGSEKMMRRLDKENSHGLAWLWNARGFGPTAADPTNREPLTRGKHAFDGCRNRNIQGTCRSAHSPKYTRRWREETKKSSLWSWLRSDLLAVLGANAQRQPIQILNLHRTSVGTDTATTCMQDLGTLLLGAAKIWAASNRLISPISHISGIFRTVFAQDQRSLTMNDQGCRTPTLASRIKHQTQTIVSAAHQICYLEIRPRSPTIPKQSHPRKHIHIKRNFYQKQPPNCQSERSLKFRCLRLSISLARAIFAMDGTRASMQRETALRDIHPLVSLDYLRVQNSLPLVLFSNRCP
ncbi:hypothetical protein CI102_7000 [Trichoderma harzianum]|nr:hypothetical protein CI102_7000 [Trichoderma harzianum]